MWRISPHKIHSFHKLLSLSLFVGGLLLSSSLWAEEGKLKLLTDPVSIRVLPPTTFKVFSRILIGFYQRFITPANGATCTFTPTCSAYALLALEEYGFFGVFIAAERIMRDHSYREGYQFIQVGERIQLYDPVSNHAPVPPWERPRPFQLLSP